MSHTLLEQQLAHWLDHELLAASFGFNSQAAFSVDTVLTALLIKSKVGWSLPHPPGGLS